MLRNKYTGKLINKPSAIYLIIWRIIGMRDEYLNEAIELLFRLPRIMKVSLNRQVFRPVLETSNNILSPHHIAILKVLEEEKELHIAGIGDNMAISKAQMTHSIDKLVSIGMIERIPDIQDRRKTNIRLTSKGKKTIEKLDTEIGNRVREIMIHIEDKELQKLIQSFDYLINMFENWN
jgi:DNA-binding MarR family transcriptional regulator